MQAVCQPAAERRQVLDLLHFLAFLVLVDPLSANSGEGRGGRSLVWTKPTVEPRFLLSPPVDMGFKGFFSCRALFLRAVARGGHCWHPWSFVVAGGGGKLGCGPRPSPSHFDSVHRACSRAVLAPSRCFSMGRCSHRCGKPRIWKPGVRELRERRGTAEENTCEGSGCRDFRARCQPRCFVHVWSKQKLVDGPVLVFPRFLEERALHMAGDPTGLVSTA